MKGFGRGDYSQHEEGDEIKTYPGKLRVFRAFDFHDGTGSLRSMNDKKVYEKGSNLAVCTAGSGNRHNMDRVPVKNCTCGFYAYFSPHQSDYISDQAFVGSCRVWGKIIRGSLGVRAQYIEIEAIALPANAMTAYNQVWDSNSWQILQSLTRLEKKYGVPVYPTLESMLADYPPEKM